MTDLFLYNLEETTDRLKATKRKKARHKQ